MAKSEIISPFPPHFAWGASTAAFQLEGAAYADGKGLSVWDQKCKRPGIWENQTAEVACDHYHRYREDIGLMREIGLNAYRFSISWPRVLPLGVGSVNSRGLEFYDRLVDELLAAKVAPWVTLFHWDFPYELYLRGGWLNPDSPKWFGDYAAVIVDRLSDRVVNWMTLNEPQCFIGLGHYDSNHAPGDKLGLAPCLQAAHHVLLAHGTAVQTLRARAKLSPQIGWAPVGVAIMPASESPADIEAARQKMFSVEVSDWNPFWNNTWWCDPVFFGSYPEDGLKLFGPSVPKFTESDMQTICQPLDFFGSNLYNGQIFRANQEGQAEKVDQVPGHPHSMFTWKTMPTCLYWGPRFYAERYQRPIVITENGISCHDWVSLDGKAHDPQRVDYMHRYLLELGRAISDGIDIRGYMHWSLMDNFEWAEGYKQRFGLIHVDYGTQKRTLKDSAFWYRDVIKSNGKALYL